VTAEASSRTPPGGDSCSHAPIRRKIHHYITEGQDPNIGWVDLPGLGKSNPGCGSPRLEKMDRDGRALKVGVKSCKRRECPSCYPHWRRSETFKRVVELECYSREKGVDLFFGVASIHPDDYINDWDDLKNKLWRKMYRELLKNGVPGGLGFFHPKRITESAKVELRDLGYGVDRSLGGLWKGVRADVCEKGSWVAYTKWGPHVHFISEGATTYSGDDFIINFQLDGSTFKRWDLREGIKKIMYLLSHIGGKAGSQLVKKFKSMYRYKAEEYEHYDEVCIEVATEMGMVWENGKLSYSKENDDEEKYEWVDVSYVIDVVYTPWESGKSPSVVAFWREIAKSLYDADHEFDLDDSCGVDIVYEGPHPGGGEEYG